MKIYLQDRSAVIELPRDIWVAEMGKGSLIVSSCGVRPYLGEYPTKERAVEVLKEIFEYHRAGKNSYIVPLE